MIDVDMDIADIKEFPNAVLVKAEKEAKKELAEDQEKIARNSNTIIVLGTIKILFFFRPFRHLHPALLPGGGG